MKQSTKMPFSTFNKRFLNPFVEAVSNHEFQKIDYQTWRIWTRFADLIEMELMFKNSAIVIEAQGMSWEFPFWDGSFGSFMKKLLELSPIIIAVVIVVVIAISLIFLC